MNTKTLYIILAAIVILGLGYYLYMNVPSQGSTPTPTLPTPPTGAPTTTPTVTPTPVSHPLIQVTSPTPNQTVTSPLTITGQARGNWYFEASFPVKLLDANGNTLAIAPAQAQGDWMTTNFVPFSVTLTFSTPPTPTGTLVLQKDNPSGLPQNDDQINIPVNF